MRRIVEFEDLKEYAERNKVFNSRDLKLHFGLYDELVCRYCNELVENGIVKQIGSQSGIHGSPSRIFRYIPH